MAYATEHADALDGIREAGAPVTFTKTTLGSYDPVTGASTPTTVTVAGHATRIPGKPDTYQALGLIESKAPTLLFAPSAYGDVPPLGASVTWSGEKHVVRDVDPLEPDGTAILAHVVIESGGA
jgi:hypothetical protein